MLLKIQLIILGLLAFSIKSQAQDTLSTVKQELIGTWTWSKTHTLDRGGGSTTTPASCECSNRMQIMRDNKLQWTSDNMTQAGPYEVTQIDEAHHQVRFYFRSDFINGHVAFLNGDEIVIGMLGACGDYHYYKKNNCSQ